MQQIIIYVDRGVDGAGLKQTVKSLRNAIDPEKYELRRLDAKGILSGGWQDKTALLVIPGGRDVYYHAALDGIGTEAIRNFVAEGGNYFGICAGAYFAASLIEFEKGGNFEVCGLRSLCFFPGVAQGPAYGNDKYRYDSLQGVEAASVNWKGEETFHVYFNGGCCFQNAHNYPGVEILGAYDDLEKKPAAIVSCSVGEGKAILSGVHLEYSAPYLYRFNKHIEKIYPRLQSGEEMRKKAFREILSGFNIN